MGVIGMIDEFGTQVQNWLYLIVHHTIALVATFRSRVYYAIGSIG